MLEQLPESAATGERGTKFHNPNASAEPVTLSLLDRALGVAGLIHTPPIRKRRALRALLDSRVTRQAVINWRRGRRQTPAWAKAAIAAELRRQAAERIHLAELLEAP